MKKRLITTLLLLSVSIIGFGQDSLDEENSSFWDKVYFGGDVQLQFGTISVINISPVMGYKVTETTSFGIGPVYERYSNGISSTQVYGGRLIAKQILGEVFIGQAEYEDLVIKSNTKSRLQRFLVGGGYREHLGGNIYAQLIFLWDVTHTNKSYNSSPLVYRGGITIGL